jgi:hypothetical protein
MKDTVMRRLKFLAKAVAYVAVAFLLMQVVPYGRTHENPPTTVEPHWDSPRTRELAVRACFDCHSNNTRWPRYADIAPFSWVVEHDVNIARDVVNFSEWNRDFPLAAYSGQSVQSSNMPPAKYRMAHPEADLTPAETAELWHGLDATLKD